MLIRHYTCWLIAWWFSESKRDIRALRLQTSCKWDICFANIKHDHIMHHKYIIISTKVSVCNSLQKSQMGMDFTLNICSVIFLRMSQRDMNATSMDNQKLQAVTEGY